MTLGDKIINERKKLGFSQEELAERLGVSRQAVSKWEINQSTPELDKIIELSRLFGVSTDYLLKEELSGADGNSQHGREEADNIKEPDLNSENRDEKSENIRRVSSEEAKEYISLRRTASVRIAFATFLCMISPFLLFILGAVSEQPESGISESVAGFSGLAFLLSVVAVAVGYYIHEDMAAKSFEFLSDGEFVLDNSTRETIANEENNWNKKSIIFNILGTTLCILSPVLLLFSAFFFEENELFVVLMLCLMMTVCGVGVIFFIVAGVRGESYKKLLCHPKPIRKNGGAVREAVETCYWLLVTAVYLGVSFLSGDWHITWIIWLVAAGCSAGIGAILDVAFKK